MEIDSKALDAATEAFYSHQVGRAKIAIDKTAFDSSAMPSVFRRLHRDSETSQVLVVSSYLEDRVLTILSSQLKGVEGRAASERLFGSNGPLGSFSDKITMAYHLGWLSKPTVDHLNNFRKIRNIFAHRAFEASYSDHSIRQLFEPLMKALERFDATAVAAAKKVAPDPDFRTIADAAEPEKYLCGMAYLSGIVFEELLVMPAAARVEVDPRDVVNGYPPMPVVVESLQKNMIRSVLEILANTR